MFEEQWFTPTNMVNQLKNDPDIYKTVILEDAQRCSFLTSSSGHANQIINNLYIGGLGALVDNYYIIQNQTLVRKERCEYDLCIDLTNRDCKFPSGPVIKIKINDREMTTEDNKNVLSFSILKRRMNQSLFNMISSCLENGKKILIACEMGQSRSATLVIFYLMKKYQISFTRAFYYLRQKRPLILPNLTFVQSLLELELELKLELKTREKPELYHQWLEEYGNKISNYLPLSACQNQDSCVLTLSLPKNVNPYDFGVTSKNDYYIYFITFLQIHGIDFIFSDKGTFTLTNENYFKLNALFSENYSHSLKEYNFQDLYNWFRGEISDDPATAYEHLLNCFITDKDKNNIKNRFSINRDLEPELPVPSDNFFPVVQFGLFETKEISKKSSELSRETLSHSADTAYPG